MGTMEIACSAGCPVERYETVQVRSGALDVEWGVLQCMSAFGWRLGLNGTSPAVLATRREFCRRSPAFYTTPSGWYKIPVKGTMLTTHSVDLLRHSMCLYNGSSGLDQKHWVDLFLSRRTVPPNVFELKMCIVCYSGIIGSSVSWSEWVREKRVKACKLLYQ